MIVFQSKDFRKRVSAEVTRADTLSQGYLSPEPFRAWRWTKWPQGLGQLHQHWELVALGLGVWNVAAFV